MDTTKGIMSLNAGLMSSQSYGTVRLRTTDPRVEPLYDMQYLTAPADRAALRAALRVAAAVADELADGGYALTPARVPDVSSDGALDEYIDAHLDTMFHYTSTCGIGSGERRAPGRGGRRAAGA